VGLFLAGVSPLSEERGVDGHVIRDLFQVDGVAEKSFYILGVFCNSNLLCLDVSIEIFSHCNAHQDSPKTSSSSLSTCSRRSLSCSMHISQLASHL
jgi:hypothetical protein